MRDKGVFRKAEKQHGSALRGLLPLPRGGVKIYFARCRGVYFSASAKKTRRVRLLFYKKHRLRAEKSWDTHTGYSERIVL